MRRFLLSVLLVSFLPLQSYAQNVKSSAASSTPAPRVTLGQSVIALNGPWKFRVGDEPSWASAKYDDSKWEDVDITPRAGSFDPTTGWSGYVPGWTVTGHPDYSGYAWYRIHVQLDPRRGEMFALAGPGNVDDVYQVFYNGVLLGSFGKFPVDDSPTEYYSQPTMFKLPLSPVPGPQEAVIAFRVWMAPGTLLKAPDAGGFHNAPMLGDAGAIEANYQLSRLQLYRTYADGPAIAVLFILLAVMAYSLTIFDREDMVYRWLGSVFFLTALDRIVSCLASWTQLESITTSIIFKDVLIGPLILGGWVMVWWVWFRLHDLAWMPKFIGTLTAMYMVTNLLGDDLFYNVIPHPTSALFHVASAGIRMLFLLPLIFIVVEGVNLQGWEGLLALPAVLLVVIAQFQDELAVLHFRISWFPFGAQVTLAEISYLTLAAVIFVLLLRRLQQSLRHQRELASDVKQAQEVQKVLIPEQLPKVYGLSLDSEYRPAREVGGDFFTIIPNARDASVLILAGDVTGKGLQAGMVGALIVGAARTQAAHTPDPLTLLRSLNHLLQGHGRAHATCLALRIDGGGNVTLANAGHLPPYHNGKELPMEGALPLGMVPNADFSVMRFQLAPGDRLVLISDGIAEAQDERGRLFGFDRIRGLLEHTVTAAGIADAAQAFGQEDDITVLSIVRDSYTWITDVNDNQSFYVEPTPPAPIPIDTAESFRGGHAPAVREVPAREIWPQNISNDSVNDSVAVEPEPEPEPEPLPLAAGEGIRYLQALELDIWKNVDVWRRR